MASRDTSHYFEAVKHTFKLAKHNFEGMDQHLLTEICPFLQLFGVFGVVHH